MEGHLKESLCISKQLIFFLNIFRKYIEYEVMAMVFGHENMSNFYSQSVSSERIALFDNRIVRVTYELDPKIKKEKRPVSWMPR